MAAVETPRRVPVSLRDTSYSGRWKIRNEGHCRMCGRSSRVRPLSPLTRHHIVPLSWFSADHSPQAAVQREAYWPVRNANANIVPLCRPCHDAVESRDPVIRTHARAELRRVLTQAEIAFAISVLGKDEFDKHYRWHRMR